MRYGDDRAPLEMTKFSNIQVIQVCPHCKAGNQVSKHWYAGNCRACGERFNRDESLDISSMEGDVQVASQNPIDKVKTSIKGEMERRAYAYKEEQETIQRTGDRKRGVKHVLNKHFDGRRYR